MDLKGLGKRLQEIFQGREYDGEFFSDLEDALIEADMGARFSAEVIQGLRESARKDGIRSREGVREALKTVLREAHRPRGDRDRAGRPEHPACPGGQRSRQDHHHRKAGPVFSSKRGMDRILLVAGDTFRAAAIDQLRILADRLDLPVVAQEPGADPGAVIFDGISSAVARGIPLVIADTAGRLHTRDALVKELAKIDKIVMSRAVGAAYRKVLVLDATTGQNSLAQAEVFHRRSG